MADRRPNPLRFRRAISLRQMAPNAVTAMALCFGLSAIRFAIMGAYPEQQQLAPYRSANWFWEMAVGAIIGSQRSYCPPPVRRVYVYDCGFCRSDYRDYDHYLDHLVVIHHVDRCDIDRYYPVYQGGYWEEY